MAETARDPAAVRYSAVAILLHWTIAALIVLQVVLAGRMEARTPEAFAVFQLHKSVGITILLLSLARLAWRLVHRPPPEPPGLAPWERTLATAVHWGFYGVMILMPLTGWIMVSTSRIAVPTLLYGAIPWPHLPGLPDLAPAAKAMWNEAAETAHHTVIKVAYGLLALHVAGALKHHFVDGAPVVPRMAPGAVARRWWEPRLLAAGLGLAAVVAFGSLYQPPRPVLHAAPPPAVETREPGARAATAVLAPAVAAPTAPGPASTPAAVRWTVQPGSTLAFTTAWSGQAIDGRFDRWSADIVFSPDDLEHSRVSVSIDMASVNTGDEQRDASLPAADWFDVAAHPKATLTATRFEKTGEGRFTARGELALRGVKRPLSLPFRLEIDGDTASVRGVTSLDRTAFGVGQGEWTSTDQIPAKVTVRVNLRARRTSP